jgi:V/A-type H+-transporting ATPase subunit C
MVRLSEDQKYGFAIGRVRALEPALMDISRYERLIRARDRDEFAATLAETAYAKFLETGAAGVARALESAAAENAAFLATYALDDWLLHLFSLPGVLRRLKTGLKETLSQGKTDFSTPNEFEAIAHKSRRDQAVAEAVQAFATDRNPAAVDMAMDRLMQDAGLQVASHSDFMIGYLGLHADVENLRTLVRLKAKEAEDKDTEGEMRAAFLQGGALTLVSLLSALPQPWPAVVELLAKAPPNGAGSEAFRDYLEQGCKAVTDRRSFIRLERLGREAELRYLRQTRYATFGHEPLVTFFLLHENEQRNLRLLYAAKLAGLAVDETKDLVAYVE